MNNKEIIAIKNKDIQINVAPNNVIFKGIRNPVDGLYDIPVQTNNFITPPLKGLSYKNSLSSKQHQTKQQHVSLVSLSKKILRNKINTESTNINNISPHRFRHLVQPYINENNQRLTHVNISSPSLNMILQKDTTKKDLITFLHGAMCSPVPSTWIKAISNHHFTTWPGLTTSLVRKHLKPSVATAKGHLNQERKNLQSTKNKADATTANNRDLDDLFSSPNVLNVKTNDAIYYLAAPEELNKAYCDLTGRFPFQSSRGNNYLLVAYHPDANAILLEPLKNCTATKIVNAWTKINNKLKACALKPNTWILDNECSTELKNALTHENITWQLVPPHQHHTNAAERAIQTLENHLNACLATVDPDYPLQEWDRLLHQVEITLNLLRSAKS